MTRLGWLFQPVSNRGHGDEMVLSVYRDHGVIPKDSRTDNFNRTPENLSNYQLVYPGDLVVNRMKAWQGSLGISEYQGIVSPDYEVLRPTVPQYDHRFLHRLLRSRALIDQYALRSTGIRPSQWRLYWDEMKTIEISLPTFEQQRVIADYLDQETSRIDTLIEQQQRLVEMLRERRWAIVERGVAMLDWNTPFKTVTTLIQTGPFGSQLKSDEYEDGGIPVVNPSHIVAGEVIPDSRIAVSVEKAEQLARHRLEEGDLIAARRGDLGRCAVVGPSAAGLLCGTGSAVVRLDRARVDPSFAAIIFSSRRNREALTLASVGSTMENLNSDIIGALRFPVPSLDDQRRMTAELDQATRKIDTLMAETDRFVELARERRSALIAMATTGQRIDALEIH
jgi:type I restriction enzyme S subunit